MSFLMIHRQMLKKRYKIVKNITPPPVSDGLSFLFSLPIDYDIVGSFNIAMDIGTININWGDGQSTTVESTTVSGWPPVTTTYGHEYHYAGDYVVSIDGDVDKIRCLRFAEESFLFVIDWSTITALTGCTYLAVTSEFYNPQPGFNLNVLNQFPSLKALQFNFYKNVYGDVSNFSIYDTTPTFKVEDSDPNGFVGDVKYLLEKPFDNLTNSPISLRGISHTGLYCSICDIHPSIKDLSVYIEESLSSESIDNLIISLDAAVTAPAAGSFYLGFLNPRTHASDSAYNSLISKGYSIKPIVNGNFPVA